MIEDAILRQEQTSKGKTSLQSILADKDLPSQLRTALTSLHQATASLVGSDGHRKLLQREGVAYTLRYGPALVFTTPNMADNKQPGVIDCQLDCMENMSVPLVPVHEGDYFWDTARQPVGTFGVLFFMS